MTGVIILGLTLKAGVHTPRDNSFGKTGAKFDTDASVQHAMSRLEEVEYRQIWQQMHPQVLL